MANIITYSIGSGNADYTSLYSWWQDHKNINLVSLDSIIVAELQGNQKHYPGGPVVNTIDWGNFVMEGNAVTDDQRYFIIRAQHGYEFIGNFNDSGVPRFNSISRTSGRGGIHCTVPYTKFESFILESDPSKYNGAYSTQVLAEEVILYENEAPGHCGIWVENNCVIDSLGIHNYRSVSNLPGRTWKACGAELKTGSTIRNSVINSIYVKALGTGDGFHNSHTRAYGIKAASGCNIFNNTVGNIQSWNEHNPPNSQINNWTEAYGIFVAGSGVTNTTTALVCADIECADAGCTGNIILCGPLSQYNKDDYIYCDSLSSGTALYNAVCTLMVYISGVQSLGATGCQCDDYNGLHECTLNLGSTHYPYFDWRSPLFFIDNVGGSPTACGSGLIVVEYNVTGVANESMSLDIIFARTFDGGATYDDCFTRKKGNILTSAVDNCTNIDYTTDDYASAFCFCGNAGLSGTVTVQSVSEEINMGVVCFESAGGSGINIYEYGVYKNNYVFNVFASGQGEMMGTI